MLALALVQWTRRLPLEVRDHEVIPCIEHLPQVVIAVGTDPQRGDRTLGYSLHSSHHLRLQGKDFLCLPAHRLWQISKALA